ncbi:MAG TPA: cell wall hydrolase [Caulobacteraceae bacterium]|nr:cell wall hydrolase [Caulobacteraceae bacterium]
MHFRLLSQLTQRATAVEWRAPAAAGVSVAAVLALTLGLSAARSSPVGSDEGARRVAAATHGDLREAALQAMIADMDPAAAALAKRYDPAEQVDDVPLFGFLPPDTRSLFDFKPIEGAQARQINGAIPFEAGQVPPAAPFVLKAANAAERERAVRCLTNAIYYEAALEPLDGRRAVAQVVLNRVRDPNFPKSVCGVVYQGWERLTGCQFSFTCDGALVRSPIAVLWNDDRKVAEAALNGFVMAKVGTATHYHADYVAPYWAPALVKLSQIGAHIFYRWPGDAGRPAAFTAAYRGGELSLSEAVLTGRAARAAPAIRAADVPAGGVPGMPGLHTVTVADAQGVLKTRVTASFEPAQYGRRQATPDEIAHINAMLEQRFPTAPKTEAPAPAAAPAPMAVSAADAAPAAG